MRGVNKMEDKSMNCLICKKELFSEIGKGCKMCGMPLEDNSEEFCCENCSKKYRLIKQGGKI